MPWHKALGFAGLIVAALFFMAALIAYLTDALVHPGLLLNWYDLNVYNDAGLITRQLPAYLYVWQVSSTVKFTYTPFAGVVFAGFSFISWPVLRWLMTAASLASIPVTAWLTLGAMGRRGIPRAVAALIVAGLSLWTEPLTKGLFLGQIEPILLLLVVWDLTRSDDRRWKGIGIGVAAGIKLIPLLFIPYLLVAGKFRQALVATGTFAVTVIIGFVVLPGPSQSYWLTGYFIRPGRTGGVDALVNQSLLGMLARHAGSGVAAQPVWLPIAIAVALGGIAGASLLSRAGHQAVSWVLIGLTSVLVSPISWDHHWVWIIAILAMIASLVMTSGRVLRWLYLTAGLGIIAIFGAWPWAYSGPLAFVPQRGLLGWFVRPPISYRVIALHGWQLLSYNLFVLTGLVIYLIMLAASVLAWRKPPSEPAPPIPPAPVSSPIDALLARADAVLRSTNSQISSYVLGRPAPAPTAEPADGP
ncbi:MAG TPA: glycosyltransferase 87 family protein [Streptosporangiaceae bacterium]|jgi:alpha-1,2-mannosyltransferase|nr:glycosyltransferase 87 family protein [Streptosporangiaceae bacterium]